MGLGRACGRYSCGISHAVWSGNVSRSWGAASGFRYPPCIWF
ncbi:Uncharacterised protein [Vibrio cholerae]|nr:Uncharacterised protein [Vibrio cholerae]